ncbi:MAG: CCC motif membrane protein [Bacteroidota bacterium]
MENRNLPNATAVLVLGICSIVTCCCYGIVGLIFGIIALVLAKKDLQLYQESPELYSNYANLNTGKILAIIGVVLSSVYLIATIYIYVAIGEQGMKDMMENWEAKMEHQEQEN